MELYEKANELQNIVDTLDMLVDETKNKYYKDMLNELKYEAKKELEEVEDEIYTIEEEEQEEIEQEYNSMRL